MARQIIKANANFGLKGTQAQAQAISTLIELIKLYANEGILVKVDERILVPTNVEAVKAIIEAG